MSANTIRKDLLNYSSLLQPSLPGFTDAFEKNSQAAQKMSYPSSRFPPSQLSKSKNELCFNWKYIQWVNKTYD